MDLMTGLALGGLVYLLAINLFGFILMGMDKKRAKEKHWRVPEQRFFVISLLGGTVGTIAGMHQFHHKTQHWYFRLGLPFLLEMQLILLGVFLYATPVA